MFSEIILQLCLSIASYNSLLDIITQKISEVTESNEMYEQRFAQLHKQTEDLTKQEMASGIELTQISEKLFKMTNELNHTASELNNACITSVESQSALDKEINKNNDLQLLHSQLRKENIELMEKQTNHENAATQSITDLTNKNRSLWLRIIRKI